MRIAWYQGDRRVASFAVETSEDGVSWMTVHQGDSQGDTLDEQPVDTAHQFACFVRIVGFGTSVNAWNSITEVTIGGFANPDLQPLGGIGVRIPIVSVYASHEQHPNVAANVIDGDFNTRWSALADRWGKADMEEDQGWSPQPEDRTTWITFELEECQEVWGGVNIAWYQGDRRVSFFAIEFSQDGESWAWGHQGVGTGSSDPGELDFVSVDSPLACFVRIVGFGNTFNPWTSITEVWIEGRPIDEGMLMN